MSLKEKKRVAREKKRKKRAFFLKKKKKSVDNEKKVCMLVCRKSRGGLGLLKNKKQKNGDKKMKIVNATASVDGILVYHSECETEHAALNSAWNAIDRRLGVWGSSVWPVSVKIEIDDKIVVDSEVCYNFDSKKWEM